MIIPPCPCGGKASLHIARYSEFPYSVKCDVCGAQGCSTFSSDFAVYQWEEGYIVDTNGEWLTQSQEKSLELP